MKTLIGFAMMGLVAATGFAGEHSEGGPKGGRLLENKAPHAEFWVNAERKVEITFYGEDMKAVAATDQVVAVTAEAPAGKVKLTMENKDGALVSAEALPDGDGYNVVVQIRENAESKPENFRIPLNMATCGECERSEYACACDHGGGGEESHEGHGH